MVGGGAETPREAHTTYGATVICCIEVSSADGPFNFSSRELFSSVGKRSLGMIESLPT